MAVVASVTGIDQFERVGARLRAAGTEGRGLRLRLNRNIRVAATPMRDAVRSAILSIPAEGDKHTGLRRAMAKATKIRIHSFGNTIGCRLEVAPSAMPAGKGSLPALMDNRRRWRHPVYGPNDSPTWVTQTPHPYFMRTVEPRIAGVREAALRAVRETAQTI